MMYSPSMAKTHLLLMLWLALGWGLPARAEDLPHEWPPKVGQPYPGLQLFDSNGLKVSLSDYRGKVIIIEPIGMG